MKNNKMTKSEAGRLGAEKSKEKNRELREQRIATYESNPTRCKGCTKPLPYAKRHDTFCSQSCSATHNNQGVRRHGKAPSLCLNCDKKTKKNKDKYCCNACQQDFQYKRYIENWLYGRVSGNRSDGTISAYIRRWLKETRGEKCEVCKETKWCGKTIPLLVDHIDGNWERTVPENLRRICGNCDMQIPTYKNKNKGNGRFSRRERYAQGKSY